MTGTASHAGDGQGAPHGFAFDFGGLAGGACPCESRPVVHFHYADGTTRARPCNPENAEADGVEFVNSGATSMDITCHECGCRYFVTYKRERA